MSQSQTKAAAVPEPETRIRPFPNTQFIALLVTIIGTGGVLATLMLTTAARMEDRLNAAMARSDARFEKFLTEAAADRRAADAKMQQFSAQAAADRRTADAKMQQFLAQAAADRRASDEKMDEFRGQMRHLGERQARLEGQRAAGAVE